VNFGWPISSRPLRGRLWRNGRICWDNDEVFYIIHDGSRLAYLYVNPNTPSIGPLAYHAARYDSRCLSKEQRKAWRACKKDDHYLEAVKLGLYSR
jgi:hypothetical protein